MCSFCDGIGTTLIIVALYLYWADDKYHMLFSLAIAINGFCKNHKMLSC